MPYTVTSTVIPDVLILEPHVFGESRSFFFESFNAQDFDQVTGLNANFVQDNHSRSAKGVPRGAVFDVAVDIRESSSNFGKLVGIELSDKNNRQLWMPPGFEHFPFFSLRYLENIFFEKMILI
jgi:dTDP-4-dehydrorhamnose 3,5-epimerase